MPALPPNSLTRRKGATPCKQVQQGDVWRRSLHVLGLEEMNAHSNEQQLLPTGSASQAMDSATDTELDIIPRKKLTFVDLPSETKKGIFKHVRCCSSDCTLFLNSFVILNSPSIGILRRPHFPLSCIQTFPRPCLRRAIPKLPYPLPRHR